MIDEIRRQGFEIHGSTAPRRELRMAEKTEEYLKKEYHQIWLKPLGALPIL